MVHMRHSVRVSFEQRGSDREEKLSSKVRLCACLEILASFLHFWISLGETGVRSRGLSVAGERS